MRARTSLRSSSKCCIARLLFDVLLLSGALPAITELERSNSVTRGAVTTHNPNTLAINAMRMGKMGQNTTFLITQPIRLGVVLRWSFNRAMSDLLLTLPVHSKQRWLTSPCRTCQANEGDHLPVVFTALGPRDVFKSTRGNGLSI